MGAGSETASKSLPARPLNSNQASNSANVHLPVASPAAIAGVALMPRFYFKAQVIAEEIPKAVVSGPLRWNVEKPAILQFRIKGKLERPYLLADLQIARDGLLVRSQEAIHDLYGDAQTQFAATSRDSVERGRNGGEGRIVQRLIGRKMRREGGADLLNGDSDIDIFERRNFEQFFHGEQPSRLELPALLLQRITARVAGVKGLTIHDRAPHRQHNLDPLPTEG